MLTRRTFMTAIGAAAIAGPAQALEVDDDAAIQKILQRRVVEKRTVGMAVCVVNPAYQRIVTWGRERIGDGNAVTPDTLFEIGSITKVFTALLLADMARRKEVRLDDPVARHLPSDFHLPVVGGRRITLADLATHTSGLPRFPTFPGTPLSPSWIEALARFSVEDFKAWLKDFHPQRPAGAEWEYSNQGYALLGMALSSRAGQSYETLLLERVMGPLGLHDTIFHPTGAMQSRLAEGHDAILKPVPPLDLGIFAAAGALRSTPRDLSHFAAHMFGNSAARTVQDNQLLLSIRRSAAALGGVQALGWEVLDAPGGEFVNKDGVTWGQAASIVLDMPKRRAVVAFSNTFPQFTNNTSPAGGGIGAADIARHLLRPQIPLES